MHTISKATIATILAIRSITADSQTLTSTFDSGDEGWRGVRLPNTVTFTPILQGPFVPTYRPTAGNPGGNISITDITAIHSLFWFSAPARFLGNQSDRYGGTIRWDHRYTWPDSPRDPNLTLPDIALIGGGQILVGDARLPSIIPNFWSSFSTVLRETNGWHVGNLTNRAPTEAEFRAVLANLQILYVLGEYIPNLDTGYIDNFEMTDGDFRPQMTIEVACVDVCWTTRTNHTYQVQYREQFGTNNWADLGLPRVGTGVIDCITETTRDQQRRFYRIVETP